MTRKLRLPSRAEVQKANAGTWAARKRLASKYGLSGAAAAYIGLCGVTCPKKKRDR